MFSGGFYETTYGFCYRPHQQSVFCHYYAGVANLFGTGSGIPGTVDRYCHGWFPWRERYCIGRHQPKPHQPDQLGYSGSGRWFYHHDCPGSRCRAVRLQQTADSSIHRGCYCSGNSTFCFMLCAFPTNSDLDGCCSGNSGRCTDLYSNHRLFHVVPRIADGADRNLPRFWWQPNANAD